MRFGLFYEHQLPRPWDDGAEERLLDDALEQIELADRLGIDHVWEVEHHFLEEYSHSSAPEVFLAAASQRTENIRLGHGIAQLPPPINHPARIAERAATLDLLSGGRLDLGTGEGSSQAELGGFGVSRDHKREQWDEALDVVVRMLTEEPFTGHRGRWVDTPPRNVVPKPKQRPHPPLWMACSRRETIEVAARKGIGALSFSFVEPEDAQPWVDAYYDTITSDACVPAGLAVNANVAVTVPFMCHEDEETAIERGIDGAHFFGYSLGYYYAYGEHVPGHSSLWDDFERYRAERGYARDLIRAEGLPLGMKLLEGAVGSMRGAVGTPGQVADLVSRYQAAGVDQVIFVAQAGRNRHEHICEALELFADQVLPRFVQGREEEEARKRERLAEDIEAAMQRRPPPPDRDVSDYVVSPPGELAPAATARPRGHGLAEELDAGALLDRGRMAVRNGLAALVGRLDDGHVERVAASPATWKAVFGGMAGMVDEERAGGMDATFGFELRADGGVLHWGMRVRDGHAAARRGVPSDPDLTFRADAADFLRIVSGAVPMGRAALEERLEIDGDVALATRFGALFGAHEPY